MMQEVFGSAGYITIGVSGATLAVALRIAFVCGRLTQRFESMEKLVEFHSRILSKHFPEVEKI